MVDTAAVMLIVTLSGPFSYSVTYEHVPQKLSELIFGITDNPQLLVIVILLFLFVMGMFLDSNVNFLLLTPIYRVRHHRLSGRGIYERGNPVFCSDFN